MHSAVKSRAPFQPIISRIPFGAISITPIRNIAHQSTSNIHNWTHYITAYLAILFPFQFISKPHSWNFKSHHSARQWWRDSQETFNQYRRWNVFNQRSSYALYETWCKFDIASVRGKNAVASWILDVASEGGGGPLMDRVKFYYSSRLTGDQRAAWAGLTLCWQAFA